MSWFGRSSRQPQGALPTVTQNAAQYILSVLHGHNIPTDVAARIREVAGNLQVKMDQARAGDAAIPHQGRTIVLLDPQTAQSLAGQTIDVQQTASGPELVLRAAGESWSP